MKTYTKLFGLILFVLIYIIACNKDAETKSASGKAEIKISLKGAQFDSDRSLINKVSSTTASLFANNVTQRQEIKLNDDLFIIAELTPEQPSNLTYHNRAGLNRNKAAVEQNELERDIRYKIVVYDANENYVTERDYTYGQESNTAALSLNGGENYIFIAYSTNNTSELPEITFSDANNKNLATSSLVDLDGNTDDLMYFRKDMRVTANTTNYLEVILKHCFSQITTNIDASATGYNITDIRASIYDHYSQADIALKDAIITRKGTEGEASLTPASGLNTMIVQAAPRLLNGNTTTGRLYFSTITIGPVTENNITAMNNLTITPGVKYNLNLTITPNDILLTHEGQSAARINGKIWMRHNLGATTNLNPDQNPSVSGLHGNYYQWGRIRVVANASTQPGAINPWNTANPSDNSWNTGTQTAPVKTSNDPCPTGYRIPTLSELQRLQEATVQSNIGNWNNNANNYTAAKVYRSRRNANVQLTFPIAGNRSFDTGALVDRGNAGFYWTSTILDNRTRHSDMRQNLPDGSTGRSANRNWAFPIRCVSIQ